MIFDARRDCVGRAPTMLLTIARQRQPAIGWPRRDEVNAARIASSEPVPAIVPAQRQDESSRGPSGPAARSSAGYGYSASHPAGKHSRGSSDRRRLRTGTGRSEFSVAGRGVLALLTDQNKRKRRSVKTCNKRHQRYLSAPWHWLAADADGADRTRRLEERVITVRAG